MSLIRVILPTLLLALVPPLPVHPRPGEGGQTPAVAPRPSATSIERLLAENPLGAGEELKILPLGGHATAAGNLLLLGKDVPLHYHARHDETVYVIRGKGRMRLGTEEVDLASGSFITIPRGTRHAVTVLSEEPLAAISIFSPPFDGKDRVYVE